MTLVLIGRDGGLSSLCYSCGFDYWPWPYLLRGWGSPTMAFTGKFEWRKQYGNIVIKSVWKCKIETWEKEYISILIIC